MRPWVLRALIMTLLHGVGQTLFVVLSSRFFDLGLLWSILLLGLLLLTGLFWGGAEVVADRIPEEWTWFKAALAAGPGAGLLNWILLGLFVDSVGVADLSSALVSRAAFTVLLVLGSVALGSRLGWLALGRQDDPRAAQDPAADTDEPAEDAADAPRTRAGDAAAPPALPTETTDRVAARRSARERRAAGPAVARNADRVGGRPTEGERGRRGDAEQAVPATRLPFGAGPFAEKPSRSPGAAAATDTSGAAEQEGVSPVVAVLPPVTPLPAGRGRGSGRDEERDTSGADAPESGRGRRRGPRRYDDE